MTTPENHATNGPATQGPTTSGQDQELDRLLDTLVPPSPSDTLRARLVRDFVPASARQGGVPRLGTARLGALTVAAALLLAVALAVTAPGPVQHGAATGVAINTTPSVDSVVLADGLGTFYDEDVDESGVENVALADIAPDSAAYVVALLRVSADTGSTLDGGSDAAEAMPLE